jgi:hypothetical protein
MEFKDAAVALTGIAVVLLALAVLAVDLVRYLWLIRDLKHNLTVSRALSATDMLLGSAVTVSYDLEYQGRRRVPMLCVQTADRPVSVDGSPLEFVLSPGCQTIAFVLRPTRRGSHAVRSPRLTLESSLFRGTVTAGSDATINAYLIMGQDRAATGSRRGPNTLKNRNDTVFSP